MPLLRGWVRFNLRYSPCNRAVKIAVIIITYSRYNTQSKECSIRAACLQAIISHREHNTYHYSCGAVAGGDGDSASGGIRGGEGVFQFTSFSVE